ncbi:glycine cleavage system protein T [Leptolyngbya sp. BL0902]|uniref:CAF17-like 4Fe-4S cluster assembly/insertion protein YgfZ n=1 Tax=Leptolyngbya sp. BL0902 TaxID=1115757 RepID=UPI0018E724E1|nr:folate-binding protein YgfZ [Leptolyngbya sp. BL0902]QQE64237.1 glycine cleavage system protein T [Leptolyngbya sp. BL0902]
MTSKLRDIQTAQGAVFELPQAPPLHFGNDAAALAAVTTGAVLVDRCHWGILEMTGADRLRFIHNQTTNTFTQRQPGEGCDTVFVTSTARTLDLATVYLAEESLWIVTSPGQAQPLMDWMDRYIFPADKVALANVTKSTALFSLIGPSSHALVQSLGATLAPQAPYGQHELLGDLGWRVAVGSGLGWSGYTLFGPMDNADAVWQRCLQGGAIPAGERLWEQWRIQQGRPMPGAELTDEANPLEAGLWHTISFDKGCYIGQETIARLNTYRGVKQQLWGLRLSQGEEPGAPLYLGDEKVGRLTSVVDTASGVLGLGYLRTKAGGEGLTVTLGSSTAEVVEIPLASRGYLAEEASASAPDS